MKTGQGPSELWFAARIFFELRLHNLCNLFVKLVATARYIYIYINVVIVPHEQINNTICYLIGNKNILFYF